MAALIADAIQRTRAGEERACTEHRYSTPTRRHRSMLGDLRHVNLEFSEIYRLRAVFVST